MAEVQHDTRGALELVEAMNTFLLGVAIGLAIGWLIYRVIVFEGTKLIGGPDAKAKTFTKDLLARMDHEALKNFQKAVEAELGRRKR